MYTKSLRGVAQHSMRHEQRITNIAPAAQELPTWLKSVGVAK